MSDVEMSDEKVVNDFELYEPGFCHSSVCTSLSVSDATIRINAVYPTGISSQWVLSEDTTFASGGSMPGVCHDHPETHKHYLFTC